MATGGGGGGRDGVGRDEEDVDRISCKEEEKDLNGGEPPAPSAKADRSHQPKTKKSKGKGQQGGGILRIDTSGDGSPLKTGGLKGRRKSSSGSADYRNNLYVYSFLILFY